MRAALLDDRAVIALNGEGARDFLQGLVTNDMARCSPGHPLYAALLTPQGKILFDFFVLEEAGGRLLIDCAVARADELMKKLILYRLRAKIEIVRLVDYAVAAIWGDDAAGEGFPTDPRLAALGLRLASPAADMARALARAERVKLTEYHQHRLALGVPDSADLASDTIFALDAGLEELNGVNFRKGCYVGQEVTARMKHRATARRRIMIVDGTGDFAPGAPLATAGLDIGAILGGGHGRALALVRLDRLANAAGPVTIDGQNVIVTRPRWLAV